MTSEITDSDVLIVDDDVYIREMLTELLEDEGYRVVGAGNGREALEYLHRIGTLPRLILLDLNMPVMSGWEFRDEQTQDQRLTTIPVVVISAGGSEEVLATRLDAAAYFAKPIDFNRLLTSVANFVQ